MLLADESDDHDEPNNIDNNQKTNAINNDNDSILVADSLNGLHKLVDKKKGSKVKTNKMSEEWSTESKSDNKSDIKSDIKSDNKSDNKKNYESSETNFDSAIFRDEKLLENKIIYDETQDYGDIGNDQKLNSHWTVWVHRLNCTDWTITGYQKIYVINSIGSFWRFFNNFQLFNTYNNQIFIMREEIAPIWEDVNNKFGGICSLKFDSIQRGMKTDISTEAFVLICLLIMNETFTQDMKNINGISYAVKKKSSLIKIWTKTYSENKDFTKELPVPLINKFNQELQRQSKFILNNDGKISIQYKQIKPEYELN